MNQQPSAHETDARQCRRDSELRRLVDIEAASRPKGWNHSLTKKYLDALIACLILLMIAPLMIALAVSIKLSSPGPVFYRQLRTGYLGRRFLMFKFRTMVVNADDLKASLASQNTHQGDTPDFKVKDDPRVTPVGKLLRRYSLDELPQLFNVIRGDMRIVGPRPTSFDIYQYKQPHLRRLSSPPGLTGLWQVSGRSHLDFDRRCELDEEYLRNQSPLQDLRILLRTPLAILKGDGAY